jgi:hypothetical protein
MIKLHDRQDLHFQASNFSLIKTNKLGNPPLFRMRKKIIFAAAAVFLIFAFATDAISNELVFSAVLVLSIAIILVYAFKPFSADRFDKKMFKESKESTEREIQRMIGLEE